MKTMPLRSIVALALIIKGPMVYGQVLITNPDSIPFIRPKQGINQYNFLQNGERVIRISNLRTDIVKYRPNTAMRDVGNGIMTMVTGIGFSTSSDAGFMVSGAISCNDSLPDWNFALFCEGYVEKERERVRNDDGSWSVETNEINNYEWNRNASGIITEDKDTLAKFLIVMDPLEDPLLKTAASAILSDQTYADISQPTGRMTAARNRSRGIDYAIRGQFLNTDFMIIHNGYNNKAWIYYGNKLEGIFQTDHQNQMLTSKKKRIIPYLLLNSESESDSRYLIRLAFLGKTLNGVFLMNSL